MKVIKKYLKVLTILTICLTSAFLPTVTVLAGYSESGNQGSVTYEGDYHGHESAFDLALLVHPSVIYAGDGVFDEPSAFDKSLQMQAGADGPNGGYYNVAGTDLDQIWEYYQNSIIIADYGPIEITNVYYGIGKCFNLGAWEWGNSLQPNVPNADSRDPLGTKHWQYWFPSVALYDYTTGASHTLRYEYRFTDDSQTISDFMTDQELCPEGGKINWALDDEQWMNGVYTYLDDELGRIQGAIAGDIQFAQKQRDLYDVHIRRLVDIYIGEFVFPNEPDNLIMRTTREKKLGFAATLAACDSSGIPCPISGYDRWLDAYKANNFNTPGSDYYITLEVINMAAGTNNMMTPFHVMYAWLDASTGAPWDVSTFDDKQAKTQDYWNIVAKYQTNVTNWQKNICQQLVGLTGGRMYEDIQPIVFTAPRMWTQDVATQVLTPISGSEWTNSAMQALGLEKYGFPTDSWGVPIGYSDVRGESNYPMSGAIKPNENKYLIPGNQQHGEICQEPKCGAHQFFIPEKYRTLLDMLSMWGMGNYIVERTDGRDCHINLNGIYPQGVHIHCGQGGYRLSNDNPIVYGYWEPEVVSVKATSGLPWWNLQNVNVGYKMGDTNSAGGPSRGCAVPSLNAPPTCRVDCGPIKLTEFYDDAGNVKANLQSNNCEIKFGDYSSITNAVERGIAFKQAKIVFRVHVDFSTYNIGGNAAKATFRTEGLDGNTGVNLNMPSTALASGGTKTWSVNVTSGQLANFLQYGDKDFNFVFTPAAAVKDAEGNITAQMKDCKINLECTIYAATNDGSINALAAAQDLGCSASPTLGALTGLGSIATMGYSDRIACDVTGWLDAEKWCYHTKLEPDFYAELGANDMQRLDTSYDNADWDVLSGIPSTENVHVVCGGDLFQVNVAGNFVKSGQITRTINFNVTVQSCWNTNSACVLKCPGHTIAAGGGTASVSATGEGNTDPAKQCSACSYMTKTAIGYDYCDCTITEDSPSCTCGGHGGKGTDAESHDCRYEVKYYCNGTYSYTTKGKDSASTTTITTKDNAYKQSKNLTASTVTCNAGDTVTYTNQTWTNSSLLCNGYTDKDYLGCECSKLTNSQHPEDKPYHFAIKQVLDNISYLNIVDYQIYGLTHVTVDSMDTKVIQDLPTIGTSKNYSVSNSMFVELWDIYDTKTQDMVAGYKPGNGRLVFTPFKSEEGGVKASVVGNVGTSYRNGVNYPYVLGDVIVTINWVMNFDAMNGNTESALMATVDGIPNYMNFVNSISLSSNIGKSYKGDTDKSRWDLSDSLHNNGNGNNYYQDDGDVSQRRGNMSNDMYQYSSTSNDIASECAVALVNRWMKANKGTYAVSVVSDALALGSLVKSGSSLQTAADTTIAQEIISSVHKTASAPVICLPFSWSGEVVTIKCGGDSDRNVSSKECYPESTMTNLYFNKYKDDLRYNTSVLGVTSSSLLTPGNWSQCDVIDENDILKYGYLGQPGVYNTMGGNFKRLEDTLPQLLKNGEVQSSNHAGQWTDTTEAYVYSCYKTNTTNVGYNFSAKSMETCKDGVNDSYLSFAQNLNPGESGSYYNPNVNGSAYNYKQTIGVTTITSTGIGNQGAQVVATTSNCGAANISVYGMPYVVNNIRLQPTAANGTYINTMIPTAHYTPIVEKKGNDTGWYDDQHPGYWTGDRVTEKKSIYTDANPDWYVNPIVIHNPISTEYCQVVSNDDTTDNYTTNTNFTDLAIIGHDQRVNILPDGNSAKNDYVVVDNEFYVFWSDMGNFHDETFLGIDKSQPQQSRGEGSLGLGVTFTDLNNGIWKPNAGDGYSTFMNTSKWIAKRYVQFDFAVEYWDKNGTKQVAPAGTAIDLSTMQKTKSGVRRVISENLSGIYNPYETGAQASQIQNVYGDYYKFRVGTGATEVEQANVTFISIANNDPMYVAGELTGNPPADNNHSTNQNRDAACAAPHSARWHDKIDVVGRIGNVTLEDTEDYRFASLFKTVDTNKWIIDQLVNDVNMADPYKIGQTRYNIFFETATADNNYHGSTGLTDDRNNSGANAYNGKGGIFFELPLTAADNHSSKNSSGNVILNGEELRLGYDMYLDFETIGNYYGTDGHNSYVIPRYFYVKDKGSGTEEWVPVDIYYGDTGKEKKYYDFSEADKNNALDISKGTVRASSNGTTYNIVMEYNKEKLFRNHREQSEILSDYLYNKYAKVYPNATLYDYDEIGNSELLTLDSHDIIYIGSIFKNGYVSGNTIQGLGTLTKDSIQGSASAEDKQVICTELPVAQPGESQSTQFYGTDPVSYVRQAQEWNFKLGLPSTAVAVKQGSCDGATDGLAIVNAHKKLTGGDDTGIIVCLTEIVAVGDTWTLQFKNRVNTQETVNGSKIVVDDVQAYSKDATGYYFTVDSTDGDGKIYVPSAYIDYIPIAIYGADVTANDDLGSYGSH